MKVLVAMDSLKGSLSSAEANAAISQGLLKADSRIVIESVSIADGGEGTVEALLKAVGGKVMETEVTGPLQVKVQARYGILHDGTTAIIEVAEACGITLLSNEQKNPLYTTSYGVGELILHAIEQGCHHFIVGLGGTATTDAGIGMLQALGYRFLNKTGEEVGNRGTDLIHIEKIDTSQVNLHLKNCSFQVACDVSNPLYGENGAAYIFGPQKGASEEVVRELDQGLEKFAKVVDKQLGVQLQSILGAGAAGGLGAAFAGILQAKLESGVQLVLEKVKLEDKLKEADLVITGEGKLDNQTSMGKAPTGVALLAKKYGKPVIILAGDVSQGHSSLHDSGITAYFSIVHKPISLENAMIPDVAKNNLTQTAEQLLRAIQIGKNLV